jgi:hypothetical protein
MSDSVKISYAEGKKVNWAHSQTIWQACFHPSHTLLLSAYIKLVKERSRTLNIWAAQLDALTTQFTKLYDRTWAMGYLGKIEFASSTNLDSIWGRVYERPRKANESDPNYMKRLQIYVNEMTCCGTKANCESIISSIVGLPNSCRIDPYWPAHCRVYITDYRAAQKARDRIDLINAIIPEILALGTTYEFFNNFYDLPAYMGLLGTAKVNLTAQMAIKWDADDERLWMELPAYCGIAIEPLTELPSYIALASDIRTTLKARTAIKDTILKTLIANLRLKATHTETLSVRCYRAKSIPTNLRANAAIAKSQPMTLTARMMIEDS